MPENTAKKVCLIGWPAGYSRSPLIHGYWLKRHDIAGSYHIRPVRPGELEDFLTGFTASGLAGCNVTIPHKETAFEIISHQNRSWVSPRAKRLGAINTVWIENGVLHADNTDAYGFLTALREEYPHWRPEGKNVLIIGAGGAAHAIAYDFADAGTKTITVANRTLEHAVRLAENFGPPLVPAALADVADLLGGVDILVNATSLGMDGHPQLRLPLEALPPRAIVADIVYAPLETGLLRDAAARGLKTLGGLGMLMHQAVPGFEKWFGVRPEVTPELRKLLEADIASC